MSLNSTAARELATVLAANRSRGRSAARTFASQLDSVNSSSSDEPQLLSGTTTAPIPAAAANVISQSGPLRMAMAIRSPGATPTLIIQLATEATWA